MHLPHVHRRNAALLPASAGFGALLLVFGLFHSQNLFQGLWTLLSHEDVLITDYVALCGIGPAFVNAGLVTLIAVGIFYLVGETPNGSTLVTISLMAGFSLFGKNILNIWPILFGTALYALWRREPFSKYVNVAMLGTSLAPMVSFMGCDVSPWLGAVVGLLIGFLIAPVSEYAFRIQNGMNLYSTGFACGLVAMIFVPIFKALGLNPASHLIWSAGNNLTFGIDDNATKTNLDVPASDYFDNNWHFLTCVRDSANKVITMYIDGALVGTKDDATGDIFETEDMVIGNCNVNFNTPFQGAIDELVIYTGALSAPKVKRLYEEQRPTGAIDETTVMSVTERVNVFPTVFNDEVTVTLNGVSNEVVEFTLYGASGSVVYNRSLLVEGATPLNISGLSELPQGYYTLTVTTSEGTFSRKLIKE